MKTVYLTAGPRGSGKSTYVLQEIIGNPQMQLISRDEISKELFQAESLNPYFGAIYIVMNVLFREIEKILSSAEDVDVILDCWNGYSRERKEIIRRLKMMGADRIVCWLFFVPVDICAKWFMLKPDSKGYSEEGARKDHNLYYKLAKDIEDDGFDEIRYVNPCQLRLPGFY